MRGLGFSIRPCGNSATWHALERVIQKHWICPHMYYRQAVPAMAAVVVPPLVPPSSSCQLQALVGNGGPCFSLRSHHNQVWRLRGPATSGGGGGSGYMATHSAAGSWRLRVTAESASVETEPAEDEAEVPQGEAGEEAAPEAPAESAGTGDQLTMMLTAEGSMPDISIPNVKKILEEMENVSDVKISTFEGLTSITLTKKTVIQATNVASELVDAMEKGGFRLHTLNLAIDDEE